MSYWSPSTAGLARPDFNSVHPIHRRHEDDVPLLKGLGWLRAASCEFPWEALTMEWTPLANTRLWQPLLKPAAATSFKLRLQRLIGPFEERWR